MKDWHKAVIAPDTSLRDAIARIDATGLQLAIVLDAGGRLAGILSDGDVRRAILRGTNLSAPVSKAMNRQPITADASMPASKILAMMRSRSLHHVPVVGADGRLLNLALLDEYVGVVKRPNSVVLMAGGLGTRLLPLTKDCPKPMLHVGGKPILENIIEAFAEQGFRKFFLAVNYLAAAVEDFFGDGGRHGVEIQYLHENKRLGTAGALSLLPALPEEPLLVMNGDLLTRARFDQILQFHEEHAADATMAVREYDFQVPYGVVKLEGEAILAIEEKPMHRFFVNAGIYALSPATLALIPQHEFFDMPTLFERIAKSGRPTVAYPLREYWLDVGRIEELERAQNEWVTEGP